MPLKIRLYAPYRAMRYCTKREYEELKSKYAFHEGALSRRTVSKKGTNPSSDRKRILRSRLAKYRGLMRSKFARPSRSANTSNGRLPSSSCMSLPVVVAPSAVEIFAFGAQ